jgi:hypothetical protein
VPAAAAAAAGGDYCRASDILKVLVLYLQVGSLPSLAPY